MHKKGKSTANQKPSEIQRILSQFLLLRTSKSSSGPLRENFPCEHYKALLGLPRRVLGGELFKGCFTIRVHLQKLHSSPVLTVEAYFDFKVLAKTLINVRSTYSNKEKVRINQL